MILTEPWRGMQGKCQGSFHIIPSPHFGSQTPPNPSLGQPAPFSNVDVLVPTFTIRCFQSATKMSLRQSVSPDSLRKEENVSASWAPFCTHFATGAAGSLPLERQLLSWPGVMTNIPDINGQESNTVLMFLCRWNTDWTPNPQISGWPPRPCWDSSYSLLHSHSNTYLHLYFFGHWCSIMPLSSHLSHPPGSQLSICIYETTELLWKQNLNSERSKLNLQRLKHFTSSQAMGWSNREQKMMLQPAPQSSLYPGDSLHSCSAKNTPYISLTSPPPL